MKAIKFKKVRYIRRSLCTVPNIKESNNSNRDNSHYLSTVDRQTAGQKISGIPRSSVLFSPKKMKLFLFYRLQFCVLFLFIYVFLFFVNPLKVVFLNWPSNFYHADTVEKVGLAFIEWTRSHFCV